MNFIQNLDTVFPVNAYNDNVVEFREVGAVRAMISVAFVDVFEITGINGNFYFNFKEVFKEITNQKLFSDEYGCQNIERDDDALKWISVAYRTFSDTGSQLDIQLFTYKVARGVIQIEDETGQRNFLHHSHNNEVYLDVFEGLPFELSYYHQETSNNNITITSQNSSVNFSLFSHNEDVYRIPLIGLDGQLLHQYSNSNYLSFTEGYVSSFQFLSSTYPQAIAKINYHRKCKGFYLKWLNTYGGWDYWLFSDKAKIDLNDKEMGRVYTGFDNIQNLQSLESSMGKTIKETKQLTSSFLTEHQFSKVIRLAYSPKVYLWTGSKWVECFIDTKTKFTSDKQRGEVKFKLNMPKRITQTV